MRVRKEKAVSKNARKSSKWIYTKKRLKTFWATITPNFKKYVGIFGAKMRETCRGNKTDTTGEN